MTSNFDDKNQIAFVTIASNDNEEDRYMALDSEPISISSKALVEDLTGLVHAGLETKQRKIRMKLRTAVAATIADLLGNAVESFTRRGFRPMATDSFTGMHVGHACFTQVIAGLEAHGLIEVIKGERYSAKLKEEKGVATSFRATSSFFEMAVGYGVTPQTWPLHFRPCPRLAKVAHPILLRSSSKHQKGKKLVGKAMRVDKALPVVRAMSQQIDDLNGFMAKQTLCLGKWKHRFFQRIFSQGDCFPVYLWDRGGRIYSPGTDGYQQAPSEERASFRFNGEATVEVDIGSSFLTIYRAKMDIDFDPEKDAYDIPGLSRFAAKAWVVMTFGHDRFHSRWPQETKDKYRKKYEKHGGAEWGTGDLQKDHPIRTVERLMLAALPELADWPNSTIRWGELQYTESCVMVETVHTLAMKFGIPALPVHDSIRVPASKQDIAINVLSDAFANCVGVRPVIKVK